MRFHKLLDSVENTDKEEELRQRILEVKEYLIPVQRVPFVGKPIRALIVFGDFKSAADFRQSKHYADIKDWNVNVALEGDSKSIAISPSGVHIKKMLPVLACIGVGISFIVLLKKKRCK